MLKKNKNSIIFFIILAVAVSATGVFHFSREVSGTTSKMTLNSGQMIERKIIYDFDEMKIINGAPSMQTSNGPFWWVSSGGSLTQYGGIGMTIQDELPRGSYWRSRYEESKPESTEDGRHPQNIFRAVTKYTAENFEQKLLFKITEINTSESKEREPANGVHLMNRYKDQDNLYYAGIRVDGQAVIKKKIRGEYYTLASNQIFKGTYDREKNPNLIPTDQWIGIKSRVLNLEDGVFIAFFIDTDNDGDWRLAVSALDTGERAPVIRGFGHAGIRTDFMDVFFQSYTLRPLGTSSP